MGLLSASSAVSSSLSASLLRRRCRCREEELRFENKATNDGSVDGGAVGFECLISVFVRGKDETDSAGEEDAERLGDVETSFESAG